MEELIIKVERQSSENELGLSVYRPDEIAIQHGIHEGLQITSIKPGSDIDKNGNFRINDIIIEMNLEPVTNYDKSHRKLKKLVRNFPRTPLMLKVLRLPEPYRYNPEATNGTKQTHTALTTQFVDSKTQHNQFSLNQMSHHQKNQLSFQQQQPQQLPYQQEEQAQQQVHHQDFYSGVGTRRTGIKHTIRLKKGKYGFGIKIAERDNLGGIYITAITSTGSDLKEGDMLLEVNGINLTHKSQHEVTSMLKSINTNALTEFVVSRNEPKSDCRDKDLEFENNVDEPKIKPSIETYTFDIPLNHTNTAGLGLSLAYEIDKKTRKSLRIYAMNILTEGAAWKDGRLKPGDQILSINGISPVGLTKEQASETLNAAVSRGIGPESKPDTIRLTVQRQIYEACLSAEDSNTSKSSAADPNDSTMSPLTQASNSNKISHDSSSKTNDTSSAISQITDMTTLPAKENSTSDKSSKSEIQQTFTSPKTLDPSVNYDHNNDVAICAQSCDEESVVANGDSFQRDGFGRQSISEKRHATLNAKNTDTFKRNQKLREERERQKQMQEQLDKQKKYEEAERLKLEANNLPSNNTHNYHTRHISSSSSTNFIQNNTRRPLAADQVSVSKSYGSGLSNGLYREVPVDAQVTIEPHISSSDRFDNDSNNLTNIDYTSANVIQRNDKFLCDNNYGHFPIQNHRLMQQFPNPTNDSQYNYLPQPSVYNPSNRQQFMKRSNSLESIQNIDRNQDMSELLAPKFGTVRVSRHRKINESFRAAVDRSYEIAVSDSHRISDNSNLYNNCSQLSNMMTTASNSTSPTSTEYRPLVRSSENSGSQNSKRGSLLSRFLKFGSMKKKDKKKNNADANVDSKKTSNGKGDVELKQQIENIHPSQLINDGNRTRALQYNGQHGDSNMTSNYYQDYITYKPQQAHYGQLHQPPVVETNGNMNQIYHHQRTQQSLNQNNAHGYQQQLMHHIQPRIHQPVDNGAGFEQIYQPHHALGQMHLTQQQIRQPQINHQFSQLTTNPSQMHQQMNSNKLIQVPQHLQNVRTNHALSYQQPQRTNVMQPINQHVSQRQQISQQVHHGNQNGLWVANLQPPTSGNSHSHSPQAPHESPSMNSMYIQMLSQQQAPYVTQPVTTRLHQNGNASQVHQSPIMTGYAPKMTQQRLQSQQPQQIYYYDF